MVHGFVTNMKEQLELFLIIASALGVVYAAAKVIITLQLKSKQASIDKSKNEGVLVSIDKKLEALSTDISDQTLKIQKVERDGLENITLTKGLLGSVDRMKEALANNRVEQAKIKVVLRQHSRELRSLRDTQRIKSLE